MTPRVAAWVERADPRGVRNLRGFFGALARNPRARGFVSNLVAYEWTDDAGTSHAIRYLAAHGESLAEEEFRWVLEQIGTWLSAWEVVRVHRGEGLDLRDLLTGAERTVSGRRVGASLAEGDVVLGRVVRHGAAWALAGCHPGALGRGHAEAVLRPFRQSAARGSGEGGLTPRDLQGARAIMLGFMWQVAVRRSQRSHRRRSGPPWSAAGRGGGGIAAQISQSLGRRRGRNRPHQGPEP